MSAQGRCWLGKGGCLRGVGRGCPFVGLRWGVGRDAASSGVASLGSRAPGGLRRSLFTESSGLVSRDWAR